MKPDGNNVQFEETDNPRCWMRQGHRRIMQTRQRMSVNVEKNYSIRQ